MADKEPDKIALTKVVGRSLRAAKGIAGQCGWKTTIVEQDGRKFVKKLDADPHRLNFVIQDSIVKSATIG